MRFYEVTPECTEACELRFQALQNTDSEQKQVLELIVSRLGSLRNWLVATALLMLAQTLIEFLNGVAR
jgi:hypothetical protein